MEKRILKALGAYFILLSIVGFISYRYERVDAETGLICSLVAFCILCLMAMNELRVAAFRQ